MEASSVEYGEDNFIIIKGRFKAVTSGMYGQFIIVFSGAKKIESFNAVVSSYSDIFSLEPHAEWSKYEETILSIKWRGNLNASMTSGIMDQFKKLNDGGPDLDIIFRSAFDYNYKELDIALHDFINHVVHDRNLVIETGVQEVPSQAFHAHRAQRSKPAAPKAASKSAYDDFTLEEGAVMLPVRPIVSPVSGKPIYEIRAGDRLMVNLLPNNERANNVIDSLQLRSDAGVRPAPAEVIDIKAGTQKNEPTEILVSISRGVYGVFSEDQRQVKLKLYNPSVDGPGTSPKGARDDDSGAGRQSTISRGVVIMLALFLLILVIFILLIIISW